MILGQVGDLVRNDPGQFRLAVEPGEQIGVIGPSAAGKTTLARTLVGVWPVLSGSVRFDGHEISIGASVGLAIYPEDGTEPELLLKLADEQMYDEKKER